MGMNSDMNVSCSRKYRKAYAVRLVDLQPLVCTRGQMLPSCGGGDECTVLVTPSVGVADALVSEASCNFKSWKEAKPSDQRLQVE
jgi:hypothetical protein